MIAALAAATVVALAAAVLSLRRRYLLVTVEGASMLPTLRPGDRVLVRRGTAALRPGCLVVAGWPPDPARGDGDPLMVKRVAALPGDPVPATLPETADTAVPAGRVVLLGDNPAASSDSRQHGLFALADVRGVVVRHFTAAQG
ncbi:S26 family signal peptidase [Catellatospora methionotrophica]|uniref:S26 family signal peptidase n=1 Tax=Catellatospora methionotrophica TaxID=121620 RepID=A0A8J3PIL1_9ACTN|nr:S26 family signal peptidase [Catellatospora methionotrophica]GIG16511.1 S26 family signal peptidase [Catellatospora methionotrophica]